jgi:hypothetical protein
MGLNQCCEGIRGAGLNPHMGSDFATHWFKLQILEGLIWFGFNKVQAMLCIKFKFARIHSENNHVVCCQAGRFWIVHIRCTWERQGLKHKIIYSNTRLCARITFCVYIDGLRDLQIFWWQYLLVICTVEPGSWNVTKLRQGRLNLLNLWVVGKSRMFIFYLLVSIFNHTSTIQGVHRMH